MAVNTIFVTVLNKRNQQEQLIPYAIHFLMYTAESHLYVF